MTLSAPFPYFGGKSHIASEVWPYFGRVRTYIEPFAGSLGVLLGKPPALNWNGNPLREIVNDLNGHIVNVWRAVQLAPSELSAFIEVNCPVFEIDLRARQRFLTEAESDLVDLLLSDPKAYDLEAAAYWIAGISAYIGHSFPYDDGGRPHVNSHGMGVHALNKRDRLEDVFLTLSQRLRYVKMFCGDWTRAVTRKVMEPDMGPVAVFLDPPYTAESGRKVDLYDKDDLCVGHDVYQWCLRNGDDPDLRIALCGLEGEYDMPQDWKKMPWSARGNFNTASRERIWFSPHCLDPEESVIQDGLLGPYVTVDDDSN